MKRLFFAAFIAGLGGASAFATCPFDVCVGDLNADQRVTLTDLSILLTDFGCPAMCPGDVNGDGYTDLQDLSLLLTNFGNRCGPFEYPPPAANAEAEQIALEMLGPGGPLFATAEDVQRVAADLAAIRAFEVSLADQTHSGEWVNNHLIVGLTAGGPNEEYACLNRYYGAVLFGSIPSLRIEFLRFPRALNPEGLATIYAAAAGVAYAEPDGLIGGANFWRPTPGSGGVWRWQIDDGFLDCFDGCDCHRLWTFDTDAASNVTFVSYEEFGQEWCEFP
jgi:hypothetical protein